MWVMKTPIEKNIINLEIKICFSFYIKTCDQTKINKSKNLETKLEAVQV